MLAAHPPAIARVERVPAWAWVALLAVVAFALRAVLLTDSLAGDELFARYDVLDGGPADVVDRLREGSSYSPEVSPPLYFLLAWAAHAVAPVDEALRAPSVIASAVTVWLVFALGRRVAGPGPGLVAAAIWTFSPFAIFYGSEARPYALLAATVAGAVLALLVALERGGTWRWVVAGALASAAVYTHYTGVTVIIAIAAWAFVAHPPARRAIVATYVLAAVSFLPWVGELRTDPLYSYDKFAPKTVADVLEVFARALPGHPLILLRTIPGLPALGLFAVAAASVCVAALWRLGPRRAAWARLLRGPGGAVLVAALATPVSLGLFSLADRYTVFFPRSLTPSLPAAIVILAVAAWSVRAGWWRAVAVSALLAPLAFGAVCTLDPDNRRPDYARIAAYLDRVAKPGDLVVHSMFGFKGTAIDQVLVRSMDHPLAQEFLGLDDARIWERASRIAPGNRVYLLVVREDPLVRARPPASTGLVEVGRGPTAPGWGPVDVLVYEHPRQ